MNSYSSDRQFVRSFVRSSVHPSRNVSLCNMNKRLDIEASVFAHTCTLTSYIRLPISFQILNFLSLQFQGHLNRVHWQVHVILTSLYDSTEMGSQDRME